MSVSGSVCVTEGVCCAVHSRHQPVRKLGGGDVWEQTLFALGYIWMTELGFCIGVNAVL